MVGPARIDEAGHDHGEDEFTTEFINFLVPRRFTTAQRAAFGARMRSYWARRRKKG
jgi:hypothetical protein